MIHFDVRSSEGTLVVCLPSTTASPIFFRSEYTNVLDDFLGGGTLYYRQRYSETGEDDQIQSV